MELVCPAGNPASLRAAVAEGADAVYLGFRDMTNARHFTGLNFASEQRMGEAIEHAHRNGTRVFVAINTYAGQRHWQAWKRAVDRAAALGADAVIAADISVLDHAARHWPELALHLSVQGSATNVEALRFYHERFGVRRAVLPRVLSLQQVRALAQRSPVELEVFGFGSLCIMAEGRCLLSSYVTGQSPNTCGVCSPAGSVSWTEHDGVLESRLAGVVIDRYREGEKAGYPTLCKGRFEVGGELRHALEEPVSLNTLDILGELHAMGIAAIKLEGRQRSPAYVASATRIWREAIDSCLSDPDAYHPLDGWQRGLAALSEGAQTTLGAYARPWR